MREALLDAARSLEQRGLAHGATGNLSVREANGFLITPSGVPTRELSATQMVALGDDGAAHAGQLRPSSEWPFHHAVYRNRPDVHAIVHVHSPFATALACTRQPLPAVHYTIALTGRDHVPCAEYARFGSPELADNIVRALGKSGHACLMANHGSLTTGARLEDAVALAEELEFLCRIYLLSRVAGDPVLLDESEMRAVMDGIRDYARPVRGD